MKSYVLIEKFKSKICSKCHISYPSNIYFFQKQKSRNNTFRSDCKLCHNKQNKEWINSNLEYRKKYYKNYCIDNKKDINRNKLSYKKHRKQNDNLFKLSSSIRNLISSSLKKQNISKTSKTYDILGCTYQEFKLHIESKFQPWMNWNNYGLYNGELNYGWDFDHIISISSATNEKEIIELNHYTNFQPLCSKVNRDIKK